MSTIESQFLESNDLTEFEGEWIAILDKKVIAHNKTLTEVYDKVAEAKLVRTPLFHRMPKKDEIETRWFDIEWSRIEVDLDIL